MHRLIAGLTGLLFLSLGFVSPASAESVDPPSEIQWSSWSGSTSTQQLDASTAGVISPVFTAGGCSYKQKADDPHRSAGEVSVHGWWSKWSGTCPSKATVKVYLQAYGCATTCTWVTVGSGSGKYFQGGGKGKRATARQVCASSRVTGFRAVVDVDLPGIIDPGTKTYSGAVNVACSPPGPHK